MATTDKRLDITDLDFDDIKGNLKTFMKNQSDFTDYDFEGSGMSALLDVLAYNTHYLAMNMNMAVNESFLDSATLRENVVSLASNIGYTPRSRTAANAQISFDVQITNDVSSVTLQPGLVCTGDVNNETYTFAITESISANVVDNVAKFENINIFQGTYLEKTFIYDGSLDQRFILDNPSIDTSTIIVYVKDDPSGADKGILFTQVDNILNIDSNSPTFLIQ